MSRDCLARISDPVERQVFEALFQRSWIVFALAGITGLSRSAISEALARHPDLVQLALQPDVIDLDAAEVEYRSMEELARVSPPQGVRWSSNILESQQPQFFETEYNLDALPR